MTRYHLAQLNIGKLAAPLESPQLAGFVAMLGPVNALADAAPGFVWRLQDADGPGATGIRPCGPGLLVNMSVWETLESLRDFVYRNGPHLDMMRRRREFFQKLNEHYLVLWWVPAGHIPNLDEALARLQLLRRAGPGPAAFTFREPYPPPAEVPGGQRAEPAGQCPAASRREASKITSLQAVHISRGTPEADWR